MHTGGILLFAPVIVPGLDQVPKQQRMVAESVARGLTLKEIAQSMRLSTKTAEFHYAKVQMRLKLRGAVALTHWALAVGLVENMFEVKTTVTKKK